MQNVIKRALATYGTTYQLVVAIEELSELQKEITKTIRDISNKEHLIEELADVEIVLEELKMILNINQEEVDTIKSQKIKRLENRLDDIRTDN